MPPCSLTPSISSIRPSAAARRCRCAASGGCGASTAAMTSRSRASRCNHSRPPTRRTSSRSTRCCGSATWTSPARSRRSPACPAPAGSFQPIAGFTYKDAARAFHSYEQLASHITSGDGTTTITTRMAGYNYVEFVVRLNEEPTHLLADGLSLKAAILDTGGDLLVNERRMVVAAGTAPYARIKTMHKGEALHVVGIPRIDLSLVSWRVANSPRVAGVLDWSLPYEMVLVAVFADSPTGPDLPPAQPLPADTGAAGPATARPATATSAARADSAEPPGGPVTPAIPAPPANVAEGDVVVTLLKLLGQAAPPGTVRGACTFSSGQRSYCATLTGPQCDQLGGAFNADDECPPPDPALGPSAPSPPAQPPPPPPPPPPSRAGAFNGSGPRS